MSAKGLAQFYTSTQLTNQCCSRGFAYWIGCLGRVQRLSDANLKMRLGRWVLNYGYCYPKSSEFKHDETLRCLIRRDLKNI